MDNCFWCGKPLENCKRCFTETLLNFEKLQACTLQLCYKIPLHHLCYFRDFPKVFSGWLLPRNLSELIDNITADSQISNCTYANLDFLSANPTKWSNIVKQFVGFLPTNFLNVFDRFVGLVLDWLRVTELLNFLVN